MASSFVMVFKISAEAVNLFQFVVQRCNHRKRRLYCFCTSGRQWCLPCDEWGDFNFRRRSSASDDTVVLCTKVGRSIVVGSKKRKSMSKSKRWFFRGFLIRLLFRALRSPTNQQMICCLDISVFFFHHITTSLNRTNSFSGQSCRQHTGIYFRFRTISNVIIL